MHVDGTPYRTVDWKDGKLQLIDQPALPHTFRIWESDDYEEAADAISTMVVRGAGAIGSTAAYGLALAARQAPDNSFNDYIKSAYIKLENTRPTAQNLFTGLEWVEAAIKQAGGGERPDDARDAALDAAHQFAEADVAACKAIGAHGSSLFADGWGVGTHCNAGWLAFTDWGSALSPIFTGHRAGKHLHVFVDETRPRGQGARLTAWELAGEGIDHHVIADNAFGFFASRGDIQAVITGADRVAANGDVANKIGTFGHAVICRHVGIPFYVAFPSSTLDTQCVGGDQIPIEERSAEEVCWTWGVDDENTFRRVRTTPASSPARNPAFDVTPADLIDGLVTEFGIFPASAAGIGLLTAARDKATQV